MPNIETLGTWKIHKIWTVMWSTMNSDPSKMQLAPRTSLRLDTMLKATAMRSIKTLTWRQQCFDPRPSNTEPATVIEKIGFLKASAQPKHASAVWRNHLWIERSVITTLEHVTHLQKCLGWGYVSSPEAKSPKFVPPNRLCIAQLCMWPFVGRLGEDNGSTFMWYPSKCGLRVASPAIVPDVLGMMCTFCGVS